MRKNKRQQQPTQSPDHARTASGATGGNKLKALQTQFDADRSLNGHRFRELHRLVAALDADALRAQREWTERQISLLDLYAEELCCRMDDLERAAGEVAPPGDVDTASVASELAPIHDRLDAAIGEAMTVRIELDRLAEQVQQRFDAITVRLAEIESRLANPGVDLGAGSQIERLDEIERALDQLAGRSLLDQVGIDNRQHVLGEAAATQLTPVGDGCSGGTGRDNNVQSAQPRDDPLARLALALNSGDAAGATDVADAADPGSPHDARSQPAGTILHAPGSRTQNGSAAQPLPPHVSVPLSASVPAANGSNARVAGPGPNGTSGQAPTVDARPRSL